MIYDLRVTPEDVGSYENNTVNDKILHNDNQKFHLLNESLIK